MKIFNLLLAALTIVFFVSCGKDDDSSLNSGSDAVVDADGNIYQTVTIGNQIWMAENLRTTKYNNGSPIQYGVGYAWYDNKASNGEIYGAMYTWHTVNTEMLCPPGWHVPTDEEWTELVDYIGGRDVAGGKLKATGSINDETGLWWGENVGATNETGFTAIPGGIRDYVGARSFLDISSRAYWWSATGGNNRGLTRNVSDYGTYIRRSALTKDMMMSVRCVKD